MSPGTGKDIAADPSLTERLQLFMGGDMNSANALLRDVIANLRSIALRELAVEHQVGSVTKTELINELWLRNLRNGGWQIRDRGHFFALASLAMRRILIDLARQRLAARRGSGQKGEPLEASAVLPKSPTKDSAQIVELGLLMDSLESRDHEAARIVDMHYFAGFTFDEIANETGLTIKQVRVRWQRGLNSLKEMFKSVPQRAQVTPKL